MSKKHDVFGEGNYTASRRYYAGVKKFVDSGRVDEAAKQAAPKTDADAAEMREAEHAALLRAKGGKKGPPVKEPARPRPPIDEPDEEPTPEGSSRRPGRGPDRR